MKVCLVWCTENVSRKRNNWQEVNDSEKETFQPPPPSPPLYYKYTKWDFAELPAWKKLQKTPDNQWEWNSLRGKNKSVSRVITERALLDDKVWFWQFFAITKRAQKSLVIYITALFTEHTLADSAAFIEQLFFVQSGSRWAGVLHVDWL